MKKLILIFAALASLFATVSAGTVKGEGRTTAKGAAAKEKILVAYFSATGTTEAAARKIAQATGGELYRIRPAKAYTSGDLDWNRPTSRCCRENANPSARPAIVKDKKSLSAYTVIFLGFPNWWNGAPRIINTFIETYGLKGMTVIPFMTSGGSGIENSERLLKKAYPGVNWKKGRLLNGATQKEVSQWASTALQQPRSKK